MDLALVLDMSVITSIIAITKVVTSFDSQRKLARIYPVFPLILAAIAAIFFTTPLEWQAYGANLFKFSAGAAYIFKFGKTTVLGK
jgi:hypothetical protein